MELKRRRPGGAWHVDHQLPDGSRLRRSTGFRDERAAWERAREMVRSAERELAGLESPSARTTLAELLRAYGDELERRGRSPQHVRESIRDLHRLCEAAGVRELARLDAPAIERGLSAFSDLSPRSRNKILGYARALLRWSVRTGRAEHNPAEQVERVRSLPTRVRRRELEPEEQERLTDPANVPEPRALLYLVAMGTGLRRRELLHLDPGDLDIERAEVTVRAANAKSRRAATLPVPGAVLERWRAWLDEPYVILGPEEVSWDRVLPPPPNLDTFYNDLTAAEIPRETARGLVDFHALRVTFGSNLARADVPLALAQQLMRHSNPALTSNVYTRFTPDDMRDAVERALRHTGRHTESGAAGQPRKKAARGG